jgi:Spy/CpxP family protein refolding chaperone
LLQTEHHDDKKIEKKTSQRKEEQRKEEYYQNKGRCKMEKVKTPPKKKKHPKIPKMTSLSLSLS